jgi:ABC-type hemin transport system substrate-binding protein
MDKIIAAGEAEHEVTAAQAAAAERAKVVHYLQRASGEFARIGDDTLALTLNNLAKAIAALAHHEGEAG